MTPSKSSLALLAACVLAAAAPLARAAAGDVSLTLNGQPAKVGAYKPQDIDALVISTGDLAITFAKDPARATLANPRGGGGGAGRDPAKDFSATSIIIKGKEIGKNLHGVEPRDVNARRSFYLDSYTGTDLLCDTVKVVKNTPEMAHFAVCNEPNPSNAPHLEHHFVMLKGETGIHPYVVISGNQTGEMRTMYKFDMSILDYAWTNERTGQQLSYVALQAISPSGNAGDETWRYPDGHAFPDGTTTYTKYNYVSFLYQTPMWGHYGHNVGAWFIPTSPESYASGPLRQDLDVHQDALILNYLGGGHLGSGGTAAGLNGRPKIHGPWYLYFNTADSNDALIADALKTSAAEKAKWPYLWVDEPTYPLNRSTVTGQLKISHERSAANAWVILGQPGGGGRGGGGRGGAGGPAGGAPGAINPGGPMIPAGGQPSAIGPQNGARSVSEGPLLDGSPTYFTAAPAGGAGGGRAGRGGAGGGVEADRASSLLSQAGDYIFFVHADANGKFSIPGVRPGTYTLYVWQDQGPICQSLAVDNIDIKGDKTQDLGNIPWDPPYHPNLLFQIGKPDRMAGEFKLGNGPREVDLLRKVPQTVDFTVGKSKEGDDWYFCQNGGTWTVRFNVDKVPTGNCYITIPGAGGGGNCALAVNGTSVGSINKPNDAAMGRQANRAGTYARPAPVVFPASNLKPGANTLTLQGSGIMYDTVILEAD
jgi:hypothetical protein